MLDSALVLRGASGHALHSQTNKLFYINILLQQKDWFSSNLGSLTEYTSHIEGQTHAQRCRPMLNGTWPTQNKLNDSFAYILNNIGLLGHFVSLMFLQVYYVSKFLLF